MSERRTQRRLRVELPPAEAQGMLDPPPLLRRGRTALPERVPGGFFTPLLLGGLGGFLILVPAYGGPRAAANASIIYPAAACFLAAAAAVFFAAWKDARRRRRVRLSAGQDPWMADHDWEPSGTRDRGWRVPLTGVAIMLMALSIALPVQFRIFGEGAWSFFLLIPGLIFGCTNLVLLLFFAALAAMLKDRWRIGPTRVEFARFPFRRGRDLEATFVGGKPFRDGTDLQVHLLCLQAVWEDDPKREHRQRRQRCLYVDRQQVRPGPDGRARLAFTLPSETPGTDLRAQEPVYWELDIRGKVAGVEWQEVFLVPVY